MTFGFKMLKISRVFLQSYMAPYPQENEQIWVFPKMVVPLFSETSI